MQIRLCRSCKHDTDFYKRRTAVRYTVANLSGILTKSCPPLGHGNKWGRPALCRRRKNTFLRQLEWLLGSFPAPTITAKIMKIVAVCRKQGSAPPWAAVAFYHLADRYDVNCSCCIVSISGIRVPDKALKQTRKTAMTSWAVGHARAERNHLVVPEIGEENSQWIIAKAR